MKNIITPLLSIFVVLLLISSSIANGDNLTYSITKEKVKTVWIVENRNGTYSVAAELNNKYKEELANITGDNIGKEIFIIYADQLLTNTLIHAKIKSGVINLGTWESEEAAEKFMENLLPKNLSERGERGVRP